MTWNKEMMTAVEERCKYKWICVDIAAVVLKVGGMGGGKRGGFLFSCAPPPPRNNLKISIYPNEMIKNKWVAALMMAWNKETIIINNNKEDF